MRHITMTGQYAGATWCGISRADNPDDTYAHYGAWVHNDELRVSMCPECRRLLEEIEEEEANANDG